MRVATMLFACGVTMPAAAQRVAGDDTPIINSAAPASDDIGSVLGNGLGILTRGLGIAASLQTTFDSNMRRLGDGQRRGDLELADFRITPSVTVSNVLSVGRQQLYIEGEYGRDFFVRNTLPDRDRFGVAGGIRARAGNFCSANLNGFFRSRQTLASEAAIVTSNLIESTNLAVSANCQRPVGIGFGINASRSEQNNKDVFRELFDARTNSIGGNISYTLPVLGTLSVGGNYSDVAYPNRSLFTGSPAAPTTAGDGVTILSGNIGYRRSIGPRLTINLGGSYFVTTPKPRNILLQPFPPIPFFLPQEREAFNGAGYLFGLAYRPGARLTVDVNASRDVSASSNVGALFTVRDNFGFDVGYKLGPSITTGIGATYDVRRYRNSFASVEEGQARLRDNIGRVYGRVTYTPRQLFNLDFEVAHQRRKSDPAVFNFRSTSAALTLRVQFGRN